MYNIVFYTATTKNVYHIFTVIIHYVSNACSSVRFTNCFCRLLGNASYNTHGSYWRAASSLLWSLWTHKYNIITTTIMAGWGSGWQRNRSSSSSTLLASYITMYYNINLYLYFIYYVRCTCMYTIII